MTPNDNIPQPEPDTAHPIGPESEARGGPEQDPGPETDPQSPVSTPTPLSDGRMGGRAALPPGSLSTPYLGPQGDESRDPPDNAPSPTGPADTV
jgi:hypothetical protein